MNASQVNESRAVRKAVQGEPGNRTTKCGAPRNVNSEETDHRNGAQEGMQTAGLRKPGPGHNDALRKSSSPQPRDWKKTVKLKVRRESSNWKGTVTGKIIYSIFFLLFAFFFSLLFF